MWRRRFSLPGAWSQGSEFILHEFARACRLTESSLFFTAPGRGRAFGNRRRHGVPHRSRGPDGSGVRFRCARFAGARAPFGSSTAVFWAAFLRGVVLRAADAVFFGAGFFRWTPRPRSSIASRSFFSGGVITRLKVSGRRASRAFISPSHSSDARAGCPSICRTRRSAESKSAEERKHRRAFSRSPCSR